MLKRTRWVFALALVAMLVAACGGAPAEEPATEPEPAEAPAAAMPEEGAYGEAPMLAEMVAAGTLPPVDERLTTKSVSTAAPGTGSTPRPADPTS